MMVRWSLGGSFISSYKVFGMCLAKGLGEGQRMVRWRSNLKISWAWHRWTCNLLALPGCSADVDVSLGGQHQGEPDAGVMEHLRSCLPHHLKQEAGGVAPVHVLVAGEIILYHCIFLAVDVNLCNFYEEWLWASFKKILFWNTEIHPFSFIRQPFFLFEISYVSRFKYFFIKIGLELNLVQNIIIKHRRKGGYFDKDFVKGSCGPLELNVC